MRQKARPGIHLVGGGGGGGGGGEEGQKCTFLNK